MAVSFVVVDAFICAWIAATALLYEVPLLTADRDFAGYPGLVLLK